MRVCYIFALVVDVGRPLCEFEDVDWRIFLVALRGSPSLAGGVDSIFESANCLSLGLGRVFLGLCGVGLH